MISSLATDFTVYESSSETEFAHQPKRVSENFMLPNMKAANFIIFKIYIHSLISVSCVLCTRCSCCPMDIIKTAEKSRSLLSKLILVSSQSAAGSGPGNAGVVNQLPVTSVSFMTSSRSSDNKLVFQRGWARGISAPASNKVFESRSILILRLQH